MGWLTAALASAIIFGFSGFLMKVGTQRGSNTNVLLLGLYLSGTLGFALSLSIQQTWAWTGLILASSVIIGLGSAVGNRYMIHALALGPASITSPLLNLNVLLIVLMSTLFYGETLTGHEIMAIALLIGGCCLLPLDPRESLSIKSYRWYFFIALSVIFIFIRNGGLKITQEYGFNNTLVLFYSYLFCLSLFFFRLIAYWVQQQRQKSSGQALQPYLLDKGALLIGAGAGFFSYAGLELYTYALQTGPASIVAPLFSLRSLVMVVMAVLVYKEKLTPFQMASLVLLVTGVVLLSV